ncbi:acyl-CoA thioester hydrolase/BAAT C-terminal domain-containing protein [Brevundimonas sp.]|uniref:acyl-CoA thioester hydrolase/BAAT C-terminal domain-containing protein n=1 Tax=Brevundimonas sp. TaxID=1871086 RepID=UPI0035624FD1
MRSPLLSLSLLAFACLSAPAMAQTPAPQTTAVTPAAATAVIRQSDLVAEYFAAPAGAASRGAVVVLGGSEGGFNGSRAMARRLAADGLDAIAVSYFGGPDQTAKLDLIPIEPVGKAIDWLRARPGEGDEPIAVLGVSKGAELALLTASRDDRIKAVVAGVPTNLVWQGIDMSGGETGASWTAAGQPLPYVRYEMPNGFQGVYRLYADSLPKASPDAEIAVERIAGPVLLVSATDDGLWPSTDMGRRIEARLKAHAFAYPVTHLAYDHAGHGVFGPPMAEASPNVRAQLPFLGGTAEGLVAARNDVWPRTVAFLKQALAD